MSAGLPIPSPQPSAAAAPPAPPPPIAGNAAWRLAATIARIAISFVSVPLLTGALGYSQWGLLALFQAVTAPLAVLDVGMSAAVVKLVSEGVARGAREEGGRTVRTMALVNAGLGIAGGVVIFAAAPWLAGGLFAIPTEHLSLATSGFRVVAVNWAIVSSSGAFTAVVVAHQRYDRVARLGLLIAVASAAAAVGVALAGGDVVEVLAAQTAAQAAGAVAWYRSATSLLPEARGLPRWDAAASRRILRFGSWTIVATLAHVVSGWTDRYVLGAYFAPAIVGFYAIAQMLYMQLYGAFGEMSEVLYPAVSHRQGLGDVAGARRVALLAGWATTMAFGAAATVVAVIGGDFISLWVSPDAGVAARTVLRLLCAGGVIGMAAVAPLHYLLGTGAARIHATASLLTAATIATTSLLAVPSLGLAGAGLGLIAGAIVRTIYVAAVWRALNLTVTPIRELAVHLWVAPCIALVGMGALSAAHDRLAGAPGWGTLAIEGVLVAALAGGAQLAAAEAFPGGGRRRDDVVSSFRPVLSRVIHGARRA